MNLFVVALLGYAIGTISFARIIGRIVVPGVDLSVTEYPMDGSDETWTYRGVSASTVTDRANWKWGLVVVMLDALKALVPVLLLRTMEPDTGSFAVMAAAVMVGHVWPVWWRFKGGRGQSVLLGALVVIDAVSILVGVLAGLIVGLIVFTSSYVAREFWPLPLAPWFWWTEGIGPEFWFAVVVAVVYLLGIREDIAEEHRSRRIEGISDLHYPARLRDAWNRFFTED